MDKDIVISKSSYSILCYIANVVNKGFCTYGGRIKCVPVTIGGTTYILPKPIEFFVKEKIEEILNKNEKPECKILVAYYENRDNGEILEFMDKYCWKNFY